MAKASFNAAGKPAQDPLFAETRKAVRDVFDILGKIEPCPLRGPAADKILVGFTCVKPGHSLPSKEQGQTVELLPRDDFKVSDPLVIDALQVALYMALGRGGFSMLPKTPLLMMKEPNSATVVITRTETTFSGISIPFCRPASPVSNVFKLSAAELDDICTVTLCELRKAQQVRMKNLRNNTGDPSQKPSMN